MSTAQYIRDILRSRPERRFYGIGPDYMHGLAHNQIVRSPNFSTHYNIDSFSGCNEFNEVTYRTLGVDCSIYHANGLIRRLNKYHSLVT